MEDQVGGWMGGWVEEKEAIGMSYCELGVRWIEEKAAVGMSYRTLRAASRSID